MVSVMMHILSCCWLFIGQHLENSWISHPVYGVDAVYGDQVDRTLYYITAFYWSVTTLTTVGYGDVKGFTWEEYCFNMFVEFIGIAFFSFVMGSINNIFLVDSSNSSSMTAKMEEVDVWLVRLDSSRSSKSLPKILYEKIRLYIREALLFDHKQLISGYEFLF
jgi:hypothetical protein